MISPSHTVYVSIGANLAPESNLQRAVALLRERCTVSALSAVYQSPAYGFADQPDFLDLVARVETPLTPLEFKLTVLDPIEKACGRDRASQLHKDGPLPLDMDILLWDVDAFTFGDKPWRVPNKGITKFAAVAVPLAELAADVIHPLEGVSIRAIAERFPQAERETVRITPLVIR